MFLWRISNALIFLLSFLYLLFVFLHSFTSSSCTDTTFSRDDRCWYFYIFRRDLYDQNIYWSMLIFWRVEYFSDVILFVIIIISYKFTRGYVTMCPQGVLKILLAWELSGTTKCPAYARPFEKCYPFRSGLS